jgi:hypothetical protein
MGQPKDLIGQRFGRLEVTARSERRDSNKSVLWVCKCECGEIIEVRTASLINGHTQACGGHKQAGYIHGGTGTPEYWSWRKMKDRCYNPKQKGYHRYGGRGIIVCHRWINSFENFLKDMGKKPSPEHSIERKNTDMMYEPTNCKWGTEEEQANNKSTNHILEYDGEKNNLKQWAKKLGVSEKFIEWRVNRKKMSLEEIIKSENIIYHVEKKVPTIAYAFGYFQ